MKYNYHISFLLLVLSLISFPERTEAQSFEEGVIYISRIIAEEKYSSEKFTDPEIIDSLFTDAVKFYNGDISEALLALTFATLPFNRMPVVIPFINLRLPLKLPSVNSEYFLKKRNNIPANVFFDSNLKKGGDKDKISHFFGNAFLAYNISFFNLSKFLGLFVEMFEAVFKVSGNIDVKDLSANYLGEYFGSSLRENPCLKVSDFLNVYSLLYFSYN